MKATTVTMLSPAFGLLFGVLFLHEPVRFGSLLGLGCMLLSVALVTGVLKVRSGELQPRRLP